ncbi:RING finger and WD repeat domain-containing protein 3 [Coemansia sp. BCRC 34962]|nr:RING finger and WD repeat domain-containing protein 3 [Coemansia sp. BCRC 34962]
MDGNPAASLDASLSSPSPPSISQILRFPLHSQRGQADDGSAVRVDFWQPAEPGPSRELARRSDTDPGPTHSAKRLRPTGAEPSTGDCAGYQRPPPAAIPVRGRLQRGGGSSTRSIVDDDNETHGDDDFAPRPIVLRTASNVSSAGESECNESNTCPICFEGWTLSGGHKLASLKCGHLFGRSCIRKWLTQKGSHQGKGMGKSSCPECKQAATVRDIRVLFARSVTAADGARVEELARENKKLAMDLGAAKSEAAESQFKLFQMQNEVRRLRDELDALFKENQWLQAETKTLKLRRKPSIREELGPVDDVVGEDFPCEDLDVVVDAPCLLLHATVPVTAEKCSSRVLAFDPYCPVVYASHSQPAKMLHTMAIVDIGNPQRTPTLISPHLHGKEIRGAQVSPNGEGTRYLLTASHDQTAALTTLGSSGLRTAPKLAARLQLGSLGWSCAWDPADANLCYIGMATGRVLAFDLRNAATPLHAWSRVKDGACMATAAAGDPTDAGYSPIHSIAAVPGASAGGLVVANSHHVYALPVRPGAPWTQLTEAGAQRSCYSLSYDAELRCAAASFRTKGGQCTEHDLYETQVDGSLDWRLVQRIPVLSPQNKIARSAVFSFIPQGSSVDRRRGLFCAVLEASRSVNVWTGDDGKWSGEPLVLSDVGAPEDIVDVRGWCSGDSVLFASLTNSTIRLYDVR